MSWAVETGAAVSSINGTTLTTRINPLGLVEALSGQGYISSHRKNQSDPLTNVFRRISIGLSFDTSRGADPPIFIGSNQQLSALSFRYQFVNHRDPRDQRYQNIWGEFFERQAPELTKLQSNQLMALIDVADPRRKVLENNFKNQALRDWLSETNTILSNPQSFPANLNENEAIDEARKIIERQLTNLPISELEKDTVLINALSSFVGAYLLYIQRKNVILDEIQKGTLVTFEYTNYRDVNAPDLSNFRFIAERATYGGINLTANASISIYNSLPAGMNVKRVRDFSFAGQLDVPMREVMGLGQTILSLSGKYQRLTSDAVSLVGTVLPNTKGNVAIGQIKFTIPIKDTGLKLPISVTFANRTEVVRENNVRGNFGFTFDLDTLFARFRPFSR